MKNCKLIALLVLSTCFVFADPPEWDIDIFAYESSGSITSAVILNEENAGSEGDLLGAFVGEELRGVGSSTSVPFGPYAGTYQFLTLIYSNQASGETVSFQFYDSETDAVYDITETYDFTADMTHGNGMFPHTRAKEYRFFELMSP